MEIQDYVPESRFCLVSVHHHHHNLYLNTIRFKAKACGVV